MRVPPALPGSPCKHSFSGRRCDADTFHPMRCAFKKVCEGSHGGDSHSGLWVTICIHAHNPQNKLQRLTVEEQPTAGALMKGDPSFFWGTQGASRAGPCPLMVRL